MGSDVGQVFPTASLHRDHSFLYALVCEKEISHMGKNDANPDLVYGKLFKRQTTHGIGERMEMGLRDHCLAEQSNVFLLI